MLWYVNDPYSVHPHRFRFPLYLQLYHWCEENLGKPGYWDANFLIPRWKFEGHTFYVRDDRDAFEIKMRFG